MKKLFISLAILVASIGVSAQESESQLFKHLSVGVEMGSTGWGFNAATTMTNFLQLRAGVNFTGDLKLTTDVDVQAPSGLWDKYKAAMALAGQNVGDLPKTAKAEGKLGMTDFHLLADLYPSQNSSFHFTVGFHMGNSDIISVYNTNCEDVLKNVNLYNNSTIPAVADLRKEYGKIGTNFGDYFIEPDQNGKINASIEVAKFKPYLGIGFGRAVPKTKRISCQFDMGVQFWGSPKVTVNGDELKKGDKSNDANEALDIISKISVYPVIKLALNGRIF